MSRVGEKFVIEVEKEFLDENNNKLYKMKGFNSLVFDENGIRKLEKFVPQIINPDDYDHCEVCEYACVPDNENPCNCCTYNYFDCFKEVDDIVRIGDLVKNKNGFLRDAFYVTNIQGGIMMGFSDYDGTYRRGKIDDYYKSGEKCKIRLKNGNK